MRWQRHAKHSIDELKLHLFRTCFSLPVPHNTLPTMFAVSASASLASGAAFLGVSASLRATRASGPTAGGRAGPVTTQAFFNFGGVKQVSQSDHSFSCTTTARSMDDAME